MQKLKFETKVMSVNLKLEHIEWLRHNSPDGKISSMLRKLIDEQLHKKKKKVRLNP